MKIIDLQKEKKMNDKDKKSHKGGITLSLKIITSMEQNKKQKVFLNSYF